MFDVLFYFLLFIIYSFLGWLIEVSYVSFKYKHFTDRGFLIGPYCPIYGFSALIVILLLHRYINDPIILFIVIAVIASVMEYVTSYAMEKLFKARWWDYTNKTFNINGRICLDNSIIFGGLGLLMMYIVNPFIVDALSQSNDLALVIISSIIFVLFITDTIVSFNIIRKVRLTADVIRKDYTEEINTIVNSILYKKSRLAKRLINAFPNYKTINIRRKKNK